MKHVIHMQLTGGKLFNAPLAPNPQRILDLCTGTGLWPIEGKPLRPIPHPIATDVFSDPGKS